MQGIERDGLLRVIYPCTAGCSRWYSWVVDSARCIVVSLIVWEATVVQRYNFTLSGLQSQFGDKPVVACSLFLPGSLFTCPTDFIALPRALCRPVPPPPPPCRMCFSHPPPRVLCELLCESCSCITSLHQKLSCLIRVFFAISHKFSKTCKVHRLLCEYRHEKSEKKKKTLELSEKIG